MQNNLILFIFAIYTAAILIAVFQLFIEGVTVQGIALVIAAVAITGLSAWGISHSAKVKREREADSND